MRTSLRGTASFDVLTRENRFRGLGCRPLEEPWQKRSCINVFETPWGIVTKFCMWVDIWDVIMYVTFGDDRLRGLGVAGGRISHFPIDLRRRPYNTLALPRELVIKPLLGLPTLDLCIPGLPPLPSPAHPSLPSPPSFPLPSLLPFPQGPHPINQIGGLGERCKLPSGVCMGQSPSRQTIWCISEPKGAALVATVFVHFHKNKFQFLYKHKTA